MYPEEFSKKYLRLIILRIREPRNHEEPWRIAFGWKGMTKKWREGFERMLHDLVDVVAKYLWYLSYSWGWGAPTLFCHCLGSKKTFISARRIWCASLLKEFSTLDEVCTRDYEFSSIKHSLVPYIFSIDIYRIKASSWSRKFTFNVLKHIYMLTNKQEAFTGTFHCAVALVLEYVQNCLKKSERKLVSILVSQFLFTVLKQYIFL